MKLKKNLFNSLPFLQMHTKRLENCVKHLKNEKLEQFLGSTSVTVHGSRVYFLANRKKINVDRKTSLNRFSQITKHNFGVKHFRASFNYPKKFPVETCAAFS
jgi:hypothetical protein